MLHPGRRITRPPQGLGNLPKSTVDGSRHAMRMGYAPHEAHEPHIHHAAHGFRGAGEPEAPGPPSD